MGFQIPDGYVYEPADLGLNNVAVAAAGGVVTGIIVPWIASCAWKRFSLILEDEDGLGATPFVVLQGILDFSGGQFVNLTTSGLWTGITNNPRVQSYYFSGYDPAAAVVTTGTGLGLEGGRALSAPYIRFSLRNDHATIAALLSLRAFAYR